MVAPAPSDPASGAPDRPLREHGCGDAASQRPAPGRQPDEAVPSARTGDVDQPARAEPVQLGLVERTLERRVELERFVEAQPEHQPLARAGLVVERFDLARRLSAALERLEVATQARRVPPPGAGHRGDGADAEADVVACLPVPQVVSCAEVAPTCALWRDAEVRRLVPAVAGVGERLDDPLEVSLHRLRLAFELGAPRMGEARPRLRLELVTGEVLRRERERLREITFQVGGALAGNPIENIERNVVKSDITKSMHRASDVIRSGPPLEHVEQLRLEALRSERDARHSHVA